jgi:hypothetical protein
MSLLQFSQLAEIVGVIAVIASLLYVGAQLKQNTTALHAQTRQAMLAASQVELLKVMDDPDLFVALTQKAELTPQQNWCLNVWYVAIMRARMFAWLQFQNRIIDSDQWDEERLVIQIVLSSRRGRKWWQAVGRLVFTAPFVEIVNEALRDQPVSDEFYELQTSWSERGPDNVFE